MNVKKLWLDLELREDVDDFFALVYALENNFPVDVVSISNPSKNELNLLGFTLDYFNKNDIMIVVSGNITTYDENKDVNPFLIKLFDDFECENYEYLNNAMYEVDMIDMTVFCGGSLEVLASLTTIFKNDCFDALIQGGFAGTSVVGEDNTLKKFRNREKVPSWNLNLCTESTDTVLKSDIRKRFVSKNICHDSYISIDDIKNVDTMFAEWLTAYFEYNIKYTERKYTDKLMHDLLALLSIVTNELIDFKPVNLKSDNSVNKKWWSEIDYTSDTEISVRFDKNLFLKLVCINNYK